MWAQLEQIKILFRKKLRADCLQVIGTDSLCFVPTGTTVCCLIVSLVKETPRNVGINNIT